jgi:hypothetical protein
MVMNLGTDNEKIMDLVDTPEFVLVQFCDLIIRRRDLRNPETHNRLTETVKALKIKAQEEASGPGTFDRYELKEYIAGIEDLLKQYPPQDAEAASVPMA